MDSLIKSENDKAFTEVQEIRSCRGHWGASDVIIRLDRVIHA